MKILHFIDSLRVGGKERQLVELLKALSSQAGIAQLLVCMDDDDFYGPMTRVLPVQVEYLLRKRRWDPFIFIRFWRLVRQFRPQIIHTNNWMASFYALPIAKLCGIKLINGSIRNALTSGGWRWKLEKALLLASDYRIANSKAGLVSRGFVLDSPRNMVVYNGFDHSRINKARGSEYSRIFPSDKKVVGMVAEFSDLKDYTAYFLAAREILKKRVDVLFVAIGDGKNFDKFREQVADCGEHIKLLGKLSGIEECIAQFDVGVLATYTEGISNSIMEYMALSKPVVATDGGGTREIVLNGITGFLVPQRNHTILAEKIEYLLANPAVAYSMGSKGKRLLEREFSLDQMRERMLSVYEAVLESSSV